LATCRKNGVKKTCSPIFCHVGYLKNVHYSNIQINPKMNQIQCLNHFNEIKINFSNEVPFPLSTENCSMCGEDFNDTEGRFNCYLCTTSAQDQFCKCCVDICGNEDCQNMCCLACNVISHCAGDCEGFYCMECLNYCDQCEQSYCNDCVDHQCHM
jgi:hypothetical protein